MANNEVTRGIAVADINDDGWPDVVKRFLGAGTPMFVSRCGREHWLKLNIEAPAPNTFGIGARVKVKAGDERWVRWVRTGGTSMYAAYEPEVMFGLGARERVDAVFITLPDGRQAVIRNVPVDQDIRVVVDEP
jgi:hypothetical protein